MRIGQQEYCAVCEADCKRATREIYWRFHLPSGLPPRPWCVVVLAFWDYSIGCRESFTSENGGLIFGAVVANGRCFGLCKAA
jgi:hypothetical protein